jgi:hypothetical protein
MKKLVTAFAACALAGLVDAQVESVNIVGYNTVTIDKQWTIIAANFEAVGGGAISLQDAFPYSDGMTKGNNDTIADVLQIQNAVGGYDIYYLSNGKNAKGATVAGLDGKWAAAASYSPTTATIAPGTALWYLARNPSSTLKITVAGQALNTAAGDMPVNLTWKHIANPYPTDLPLNDGIPYTDGMTKGNNDTTADNIQIQNALGGYDIYYMSNGKNAKGATVAGLDGKWAAAASYSPTTAAIPVGAGAWYLRRGTTDFTVQVVRPYAL